MHPTRYLRCFGLVLLVSLFFCSFVGCHRRGDEPAEIRIGMLADAIFPEDKPSFQAAKLAVEAINDAGGLDVGGRRHQVVLIVESSENTPENASRAVLRLINQKNVVAIVGPHFTRNFIPAATIAENAHIPMISPGATTPWTAAGKNYVFRVVFLDTFQGQVLARFALEELRAPTAAVLYDVANTYNRDITAVFQEVFEAEGGRVVALESYTTGDQNFRAQLVRIRNRKPGVLFLPNFDADVAVQARQARQLGIDATFLGSDAWTPETLARYPELDGAFTTQHWHMGVAEANPEARAFLEAYRHAYGRDPSGGSALVYDAIGLVFQAIKSVGRTDPESIRQALSQIENYRGASGTITFRGMGGEPQRPAVIVQLKEGKVTFHKLVNPEPRR